MVQIGSTVVSTEQDNSQKAQTHGRSATTSLVSAGWKVVSTIISWSVKFSDMNSARRPIRQQEKAAANLLTGLLP